VEPNPNPIDRSSVDLGDLKHKLSSLRSNTLDTAIKLELKDPVPPTTPPPSLPESSALEDSAAPTPVMGFASGRIPDVPDVVVGSDEGPGLSREVVGLDVACHPNPNTRTLTLSLPVKVLDSVEAASEEAVWIPDRSISGRHQG